MLFVHTTIQMIYSTSVCFGFTLTSRLSSRYSGMRGCKKCETGNQPDKRVVKSVKLRTALKSIRPTNFHTLVNQGFCGSACALAQKCNQPETFRNFENMQRRFRSEWRPYWTAFGLTGHHYFKFLLSNSAFDSWWIRNHWKCTIP